MLMPPSVHRCGWPCVWFRHPDDAPVANLADLWVTRLLGSEMSITTCSAAHLRPSACSDAHSLSHVGDLYKSAEAVRKMAPLIGMDAPLGRAVLCPLPGHDEGAGHQPRLTRSHLCSVTSISAGAKLAHVAGGLCVTALRRGQMLQAGVA